MSKWIRADGGNIYNLDRFDVVEIRDTSDRKFQVVATNLDRDPDYDIVLRTYEVYDQADACLLTILQQSGGIMPPASSK